MSEPNKSELSSWEMWVEQLTSLPEDLQLQELLVKTKEQQQQILNLSSEKSELQSLIQELQSQIQRQGEQLVKQNESDQYLKALNKKREELKNDMDKVARQTEINSIDRSAIDSDRANLDLLIKEKADKVIIKHKKMAIKTLIAAIVIEIVLFILVRILC